MKRRPERNPNKKSSLTNTELRSISRDALANTITDSRIKMDNEDKADLLQFGRRYLNVLANFDARGGIQNFEDETGADTLNPKEDGVFANLQSELEEKDRKALRLFDDIFDVFIDSVEGDEQAEQLTASYTQKMIKIYATEL